MMRKVIDIKDRYSFTGVDLIDCTLACGHIVTVRKYRYRNVARPKPRRFKCLECAQADTQKP